jgi:energy-coupling factor transporter ATP-binding protein EcfA2
MKKLFSDINMPDAIKAISNVGSKVTLLVQGHMGSGKSSMLKELALLHPKHVPCYVDLTTKDVGDFTIPQIRTIDGTPVCSFIPNEEFGFHLNRPLLIMLDEIGKVNKAVMNACLRLMLERKLGVHTLPEGSIVFATTNLSTEGVGDSIPPHARNRVCIVKMRKPTVEEWRWNFAQPNDIDPVVIASAVEYPSCFASFDDYEVAGSNQYIYDPRSPQAAFVTPRSLEKASDILKTCRDLPEDTLIHLLQGVVGERFTADLMNILRLDLSMPTWAEIVNSPLTTLVPTNGAAVCLIISKAVMNITADTIDAWMGYMNRLPVEAQALFALGVMGERSPKRRIAVTNRMFTDWAIARGHMFT